MTEQARMAKIEADMAYTRAQVEGILSTCGEIKSALNAHIAREDKHNEDLERRVQGHDRKIYAVFIIGPVLLALVQFWGHVKPIITGHP